MFWIRADDAHHALAVNHFALITNFSDGSTNLHLKLSQLFTCIDTLFVRDSNHMATTQPERGPPEEFE